MNVLGDTKTATMKKKTDVVEMRGKKEIINDNFTGKLDLFIWSELDGEGEGRGQRHGKIETEIEGSAKKDERRPREKKETYKEI